MKLDSISKVDPRLSRETSLWISLKIDSHARLKQHVGSSRMSAIDKLRKAHLGHGNFLPLVCYSKFTTSGAHIDLCKGSIPKTNRKKLDSPLHSFPTFQVSGNSGTFHRVEYTYGLILTEN